MARLNVRPDRDVPTNVQRKTISANTVTYGQFTFAQSIGRASNFPMKFSMEFLPRRATFWRDSAALQPPARKPGLIGNLGYGMPVNVLRPGRCTMPGPAAAALGWPILVHGPWAIRRGPIPERQSFSAVKLRSLVSNRRLEIMCIGMNRGYVK